MKRNSFFTFILILVLVLACSTDKSASFEPLPYPESGLSRLLYNHPGLNVDIGVGLWAWPMPMDYDRDGDMDLVVGCTDKPFNGTYLFENPDGNVKMPVFLPPVKIGPGVKNVLVSNVDEFTRVLSANTEFVDFQSNIFTKPTEIYPEKIIHKSEGRQRFNTWRYKDYNGDGAMDILVGADDWGDYGWDNAFNEEGEWTRGPLHGFAHVMLNLGTTSDPKYDEPFMLMAGDNPVDVYGAPFADLADYDGDGDLDLLCGEFLDGFSYFENTGTRNEPEYAEVRRLSRMGEEIKMDLQMITPTSIDWDRDGDVDIICGDEDGRVALIENTGETDKGMPVFLPPAYFQQQAHYVKFGALVTPVSVDWDDDGDEDLVCGNTAGYIGFIENLDGGNPPKWAAPVLLNAGSETLRIQAGYNGSIQGPAEAKWGYTTLSVADWDQDGLKDLVVNSILGKVVWYKNIGEKGMPELGKAEPVEVEWSGESPKPPWNWWDPEGKELVTQWRTTPVVVDWNGDKLNDLIMLDHEGFLAYFERIESGGVLKLLPGERIFTGYDTDRNDERIADSSGLLRLNPGIAGRSGRRKICMMDWDRDGLMDLMVNSKNVNFIKNAGDSAGFVRLHHVGPVDPIPLAGHTTSPTSVDWNNDGIRDLLIGAEDGHFYFLQNPNIE